MWTSKGGQLYACFKSLEILAVAMLHFKTAYNHIHISELISNGTQLQVKTLRMGRFCMTQNVIKLAVWVTDTTHFYQLSGLGQCEIMSLAQGQNRLQGIV